MGMRGTAMLTAALIAGLPWGSLAQTCAAESRVGSFGITGIQCERCRFYTEEGRSQAVFWTEPVIRGLDPSLPGARVLREGDAIVAVDGALITTTRGQEAYSSLPMEGEVRVRVRRNGATRDLDVPVVAVCPTARSVVPAIAGRPIPAAAPNPGSAYAPPLPSLPSTAAPAAAPPLAGLAIPAPPPLEPGARLGFGFACGPCSARREGDVTTWTFEAPPEITGIQPRGPAAEAGMRAGDRILQIDGTDITTPEGGRRFGAVRAGDRINWTLEREGRTLSVTSVGMPREVAPTGVPASPSPVGEVADVLRFSGRVGDALVEVRGGRVTVVEEGSEIVIRTGDTEVRVRVNPSGRP